MLAISSDADERPKAALQIGEQWHRFEADTPADAVLLAIADAMYDEGR